MPERWKSPARTITRFMVGRLITLLSLGEYTNARHVEFWLQQQSKILPEESKRGCGGIQGRQGNSDDVVEAERSHTESQLLPQAWTGI